MNTLPIEATNSLRENKPMLNFFVSRNEGLKGITAALLVQVETQLPPEQVPDALKKAVERWVKETEDGKALYQYAGDDMNIGDLSSYDDLQPIIDRCPEIESLTIEDVEHSHWNYDTCLCPVIEEYATFGEDSR